MVIGQRIVESVIKLSRSLLLLLIRCSQNGLCSLKPFDIGLVAFAVFILGVTLAGIAGKVETGEIDYSLKKVQRHRQMRRYPKSVRLLQLGVEEQGACLPAVHGVHEHIELAGFTFE